MHTLQPLTFPVTQKPDVFRAYSLLVEEWLDRTNGIARWKWCASCWTDVSHSALEDRLLNPGPISINLKGDWQAIVKEDQVNGYTVCAYYYKGVKTDPQ